MTDTLASTPDAHNLLPLPSEDVFVYIIIEVLDDGRGITPFVASKLFRPFVQEQDLEGGGISEAGTGLGLAIVHELAALFCGKAFVVSTPGQGSSFRFLFPARLPRDSDAPLGHSLADMLATVADAGMVVNAKPTTSAVNQQSSAAHTAAVCERCISPATVPPLPPTLADSLVLPGTANSQASAGTSSTKRWECLRTMRSMQPMGSKQLHASGKYSVLVIQPLQPLQDLILKICASKWKLKRLHLEAIHYFTSEFKALLISSFWTCKWS
jgi:hypothetical protein